MSLVSLSATELREGFLKREFTASEVIKEHLARIEKTNPTLNSLVRTCEDEACKQAEKADAVLAEKGGESPLLTGVPVTVKDMLVTEGLETSCASKILSGFIPPYDCTALASLKREGAILIGKTNMDEFAMGSSSENSIYGSVKNPWNLECVAGGSSGGSAVAVSAGQSPISLGTDTGGSIRQPAGFTGVLGLKPTYGRVSRYGAVAYASSLDQIGPFARTCEDLALTLSAISGYDEKDSTSMKEEVPDYLASLRETRAQGLKGLRVGLPREYLGQSLPGEISQNIEQVTTAFKTLGAEVEEVSLPHTEYAIPAYYIIAPAEASSNLSRYDGVRYGYRAEDARSLSEMYEKTRSQGFSTEVKRRILIGTFVLSAGYFDAYYRQAQKIRTLIIRDFEAVFREQGFDLLLTPTSPSTAFRLGEKLDKALDMYLADVFTVPANLAGLPAISLPTGLDSAGLPLAAQLIGPAFSELSLLRAADGLQSELEFDMTAKTRSN